MSEEPPVAEPSIDEVVQAIRAMRVSDLLQSTTFTFAQLAFAKLDEPTRDLDEARLAIDERIAMLYLAAYQWDNAIAHAEANLFGASPTSLPSDPEGAPPSLRRALGFAPPVWVELLGAYGRTGDLDEPRPGRRQLPRSGEIHRARAHVRFRRPQQGCDATEFTGRLHAAKTGGVRQRLEGPHPGLTGQFAAQDLVEQPAEFGRAPGAAD